MKGIFSLSHWIIRLALEDFVMLSKPVTQPEKIFNTKTNVTTEKKIVNFLQSIVTLLQILMIMIILLIIEFNFSNAKLKKSVFYSYL